MDLDQLQIQNLQALVEEQSADLDALRKQADALEAMVGFQEDQLKIRKARLEDWKSKYYAVADAITRESTGVDDLCRQARAIRTERDRYKEMAHESVGEIGSAPVAAERRLSEEQHLRDAAREMCLSLAHDYWTSDDGLTRREGTPEDADAPPEVLKAWKRLENLVQKRGEL